MESRDKYNKHIDRLIQKSKTESIKTQEKVGTQTSNNSDTKKRAVHFSQYPTVTFYDPLRPEYSRVTCPDLNLFESIAIKEFKINDQLIAQEAIAKKKLLLKMKANLAARKRASIPYPEISLIKELVSKKSKNKGSEIAISLVAKIIGVSEQSVRKRCNRGLIPHSRGKGVKRYFYLEEILPLACEAFKKDNPALF